MAQWLVPRPLRGRGCPKGGRGNVYGSVACPSPAARERVPEGREREDSWLIGLSLARCAGEGARRAGEGSFLVQWLVPRPLRGRGCPKGPRGNVHGSLACPSPAARERVPEGRERERLWLSGLSLARCAGEGARRAGEGTFMAQWLVPPDFRTFLVWRCDKVNRINGLRFSGTTLF
jgi:hypothetical protein